MATGLILNSEIVLLALKALKSDSVCIFLLGEQWFSI